MSIDVAELLAIGRSHGIAGCERTHAPATAAVHATGDFALATRLGLPGFETVDASSSEDLPVAADTADAAAEPARPTYTSPVTHTSPAVPASAAAPAALSKQQFVQLHLGAGGAAALSSLEQKIGMTFVQPIAGKANWLQRTNGDGTQTRAIPVQQADVAELTSLTGELGCSALRLSVGGINRDAFAAHDAAGPLPASQRPNAAFMRSDLPAALRRALGR